MKAILFIIAALALFISPSAANANLILNRGFEGSADYWTFPNIGLLGDHDPAKDGTFWLGRNPNGGPHVKTIWVSSGSLSNLQYAFFNMSYQ